MSILNQLENAGVYSGIEHRIKEIEVPMPDSNDINLRGRFFYLTFRNKTITEKEFAKFAYDKIVRYCIPRKNLKEAREKYLQNYDERVLNDLHDQARNLFVMSLEEHGAHLGEPGELIAFIVLEAFFNAPQIACKMFLKTSEKMPIHGSDSVHIRMLDGDKLELIWGEAKLYSQLSNAFDEAIKSVCKFVYDKDLGGRTARDRDIDIIRDMPNIDNLEMKKALLEYFDPYEKNSNNWQELYFCLAGFDYSLYSKLQGKSDDEVEEYFKEKYMKRAVKAFGNFKDKLLEKNLTSLNFSLVLLPFESVDNFRSEFFNLLGISNSDSLESKDD